MKTLTLLLLFLAQASCFAGEDPDIIAVGDWSTPIAGFQDKTTIRGAHHPTLRGRLLLCKSSKNHSLAMYLELQDCGDTWGDGPELYCDMNSECHLELRDTSGKPLPPKAEAYSGWALRPEWMTLPSDSTLRLRISPIESFSFASTSAYFVSGTLGVAPPTDANHAGLDVWQGTLTLPPMTVIPHKP